MDGHTSASPVTELVAQAARHLAEGREEDAIASLSAAAAKEPDSLPLLFVTGLVAWRLGDSAKALQVFLQCFERDPGNGTFAEVLASLYAQVGELLESLYYGKLSIALQPNEEMSAWLPESFPSFADSFLSIRDKPLLSQARLLLSSGKSLPALDKARQHVEVAPDDDEGREFYAEQLLRAARAGEALETLGPFLKRGTPVPAAVASLVGRSLAAIGETEAALAWHDDACMRAAEDARIAAARIADAPWLGIDAARRAQWVADWIGRFTRRPKARRNRPAREKLVIGYLATRFADPRDAAAMAAVARAHAKPGTTTIGYGLGLQSWDDNAMLRGAFDKWRDVSGFDPATLAKTLAVDGVDVVVDAGGFAAPTNLQALARLESAIRVGWLTEPAGLEGLIYDAVLASRSAPPPAGLALWQPACGIYPLLRERAYQRQPGGEGPCRFGSDAALAQLDGKIIEAWRAVLSAAPQSVLLLRDNDMTWRGNVARLIERFGGEFAARIDIVKAPVADDFYAQVDIALAPFSAASPRLVGEALACGVPVIALHNGAPYGAALRDLGLAEFALPTVESYVAGAAALASSAEKRAAAGMAAAAVARRSESIAAEIAAAIESAARTALARTAA